MRTVPPLLFLSLLATAACSVAGGETEEEIIDEGEVILANPDDQGKADSVFGKTLRYNLRGEWPWTAGDDSLTTDTEVVQQTSSQVRVRALRVAIGMAPGELLELSVDARAFNVITDIAFLLWTAGAGDRAVWLPTSCMQNYFQRIVIDRASREIDVIARGADGDTARTLTFAECGIPDDVTQVALFPFPSSNWWSLLGSHQVTIEANCGGADCPAPRPILYY